MARLGRRPASPRRPPDDAPAERGRRRDLRAGPAPLRPRRLAAPSDRPGDGLPGRGGPLTATVTAPRADRAEAFATLLALGDLRTATEAVAAHADIAAILVPDVGEPVVLGTVHRESPVEPVASDVLR